jgi:hypothetical protein
MIPNRCSYRSPSSGTAIDVIVPAIMLNRSAGRRPGTDGKPGVRSVDSGRQATRESGTATQYESEKSHGCEQPEPPKPDKTV